MKSYIILFGTLTGLLLVSSCKNEDANQTPPSDATKPSTIKNISLSVIKTYPHDTGSFTQGLVIYNGKLYEGTGGADYAPEGRLSAVMQVNIETGKADKTIKLDGKYFGEGITILRDTLYQLTWREKVVFAYTLPDLKKVKEFPINTEGWGITTDGKELIVSDGTSNLYYYHPTDFRLLRTQSVSQDDGFLDSINELEYINGFIYANQWQRPYIYKIDPESGKVVGRIDVSSIWNRLKSAQLVTEENVPNGIAYDTATQKIYITGKNWPELYEVQLGN